jgi:hypothetical protein
MYIGIGVSNLIETNWEEHDIVANSYKPASSFCSGLLGTKNLGNENINFKTGIGYELLSTKVDIKEEFEDPELNYEADITHFNRLTIPFLIQYTFEDWLLLNLGLKNNILIRNEKLKNYNLYTLALGGGFDFVIKKKYKVGLIYNRDLTPFRKINNQEIYYYSNNLNIKLTYNLTN